MARPKKVQKVKEPIRLRKRTLPSGTTTLYLDIYVKGVRKTEALGLYLVPEKTPVDRQQNKNTLEIANKIKAERILALQNHSVRQWDKVKRSCILLVDYLKEYESASFGFAESTLKGRKDMRLKVEDYLRSIDGTSMMLANVDVEWCRGFINYLSTALNAVRKKEKVTLSNGAAHHHQAVLNGALNKAVRDGIIPSNPMKKLGSKEKYQPSESNREFLSLEELKLAMDAPCPREDVKRAFLFSCFTGLRLSDVRALTWSMIIKGTDGQTMQVKTVMQKTNKIVYVPLSKEAIKLLHEREDMDEPIFDLALSDSNVERNISKWIDAAGIKKHITFHCSRHTFGTMMLTLGSDIYTTSKLMGHSNVTTTAIYAKIVDQKKVDTVNLVDAFMSADKGKEGEE